MAETDNMALDLADLILKANDRFYKKAFNEAKSAQTNGEPYLCKIGEQLPFPSEQTHTRTGIDYDAEGVAELYLMRYAYAYSFYYKCGYRDTLNKLWPDAIPAEISVLSIGCGAFIDYWALREALRERNADNTKIIYRGYDLINWTNYLYVGVRGSDDVTFCAADVFTSVPVYVDADIIIFPMSICELKTGDLIAFFLRHRFKERFAILTEMRGNPGRTIDDDFDDDRKAEAIVQSLAALYEDDNEKMSHEQENLHIWEVDPEFDPKKHHVTIPEGQKWEKNACQTIRNTKMKYCSPVRPHCDKRESCEIDHSPILYTRYMRYRIDILTRKQSS